MTVGTLPITAVLYGFGRINRAFLELSLARPWLSVRGIIVRSESDRSKRPCEIVTGVAAELSLEDDAEAVLSRVKPDVTIIATKARLTEVLPHLRVAAAHSRAVLCTSEELACVEPRHGPVAEELGELAVRLGTRIVPIGVNPGFIFDQWPLTASALAWDVEHISVRRIVDASTFPEATRRHLGIGLTPEDLAIGLADGSIAGHIGFRQSLLILSAEFGCHPEIGETVIRPIFASSTVHLDGYSIAAGWTVGVEQRAVAALGGKPWIELSLIFHACPAVSGLESIDAMDILGRNEVHVRVPGGVRPGPSTAALLVNAIPEVLDAPPGFYGGGALRPRPPWLGAGRPVRSFSGLGSTVSLGEGNGDGT